MSDEEPEIEEHDEAIEADQPKKKKGGIIGFISDYTPVLLVSTALHLFVLFLISLIPASVPEEPVVTVIVQDYIEKKEEQEKEEIEELEIEDPQVEVDTNVESEEQPEEVTEVEETPEQEEEQEQDIDQLALVPNDSAESTDISGLSMIGTTGGGGGGSRIPSGYRLRSRGNQRRAVLNRGGDAKTMKAVERALKWLKAHQEPNGSWDPENYGGIGNIEGVTACAVLPFLGAGHGERIGSYKKTVKRAISYLNKVVQEKIKQNEQPYFGNSYGSALILMALSEASIFGSSPKTKKNAKLLTKMFIDTHKGTAWGYSGSGGDLSVSGWIALGLKSAKSAGLKEMKTQKAQQVMEDYKVWIDTLMTDETTGNGYYQSNHAVNERRNTARTTSSGARKVHMAWVGMFQKQFLNFPKNDAFLTLASENTIDWVNSGRWVGRKPGDVYGIYYGTLACFQQQGEVWETWNHAMKRSLVKSQRRGNPKELGGSWDPTHGETGERGGRVLTTALMALCLEVYYRYDVMN